MAWSRLGWVVVLSLVTSEAFAGNVLSQISVRNGYRPERFYQRTYQFPETVRDYTDARLWGYSFRNELPSGAVRELQILRIRSAGAYVMATDLFANGRLSTMSHTVMMVFPRHGQPGGDLYRLFEQPSGDLQIVAPDGSNILIDGSNGAVRPSRDFVLGPLGKTGTPPDIRHRGLHLTIRAVGRNPFLRGTPVVIEYAGQKCRLLTDDVFAYEAGPESDVFRFPTDAEFFGYLDSQCPELRDVTLVVQARAAAPVLVTAPAAAVSASPPVLLPAETAPLPSRIGGLLGRLFSF